MQELLNNRQIRTQEDAEELCSSLGILCSCETSNESTFDTLLIFCKKLKSYDTEIQRLANGAIFQLIGEEWKQVCFPLPNARDFKLDNNKKDSLKKSMEAKKMKLNKIIEEKKDFYVQKIYDGTVINMYYNVLLGSWDYATRRCTSIHSVKWRGTDWKEIFALYDDCVLEYQKNIGTTFVFNISDTRIHFLVENNGMVLLAGNDEKGFSYQDTLVDMNAAKIIDTVSKTTCNSYKNYEKSVIGYVVRFDDREDLIVKSFVYNFVQNMVYKQPTNILQEDFFKLEYAVANSFLINRERSRVFFPLLRKYYDVLTFVEEKTAIYLADFALGRSFVSEFESILSKKNKDALDNILVSCLQTAAYYWTSRLSIVNFPKEFLQKNIISLKDGNKSEVLESETDCAERIKKIPTATVQNIFQNFIKTDKFDFTRYYMFAKLAVDYKK